MHVHTWITLLVLPCHHLQVLEAITSLANCNSRCRRRGGTCVHTYVGEAAGVGLGADVLSAPLMTTRIFYEHKIALQATLILQLNIPYE